MNVSITGTPGTGKSSAGAILAKTGYQVVELGDLVKQHGLHDGLDELRGSLEVDPEKLSAQLPKLLPKGDVILVGHLSHLVPTNLIVVLRCRPSVLEKRLQNRGWPIAKIKENVEAEALDVILIEAVESGVEVLEVDTTTMEPKDVAGAVEEMLRGERKKYQVGNVDWSSEVLDWF